jgi:SSS family transporter
MDPFATGVMITLYVVAQMGIGLYMARNVKSETDFYVAGRSLGPVVATFSVFATWFGAETIIGSSAAIAKDGLSGARAEPFGYAICLVGMAFFIAGQFRARGYVTLADFFRDRFDVRSETATAAITALVSIIWAAAQLLALAALLKAALGLPPAVTLFVAAGIVLLYTSFGGIMGDVYTDLLQGIVLIVSLFLIFFGVAAALGGFPAMIGSIKPEQLSLLGEGETWLDRIDAWAIPILGSLVTQEAIGRFLSTRTAQTARQACFGAAGLYLAIGMIPVMIGLAGAHVPLSGGEGDDFLPALAKQLLPPWLFIVLSGALLSAILSTVDSNIISVSSLVSVNLLAKTREKISERGRLIMARAITALAAIAALIVALSGESIYDLIQLSSALGQAGILIAVLFGLYSRFGSGNAAFGAILTCMGVNFYTMALWPLTQPKGADGEAAAFSGGFLLSTVISLLAYIVIALWERRYGTGQTASKAL